MVVWNFIKNNYKWILIVLLFVLGVILGVFLVKNIKDAQDLRQAEKDYLNRIDALQDLVDSSLGNSEELIDSAKIYYRFGEDHELITKEIHKKTINVKNKMAESSKLVDNLNDSILLSEWARLATEHYHSQDSL